MVMVRWLAPSPQTFVATILHRFPLNSQSYVSFAAIKDAGNLAALVVVA